MGSVLVELIPLMIGAAVVPLWIIIALLLLRSTNGLTKAVAFVGGATIVRLVQGILFGTVFGSSGSSDAGGPGPVALTLLLLVGILLWITAVKYWRKEEDPDAPPPQWMASIGDMAPLKAFGAGALLVAIAPKMWVFTLSALSIVRDAPLDLLGTTVAYLIFVIGAQSLLLLPILVAALAPQKSTTILEAAAGWLEKNNRPLTIVVSAIFGTYFLWKGISGLLG